MSDEALAALIRDVLAEELRRLGRDGGKAGNTLERGESVSISSDADLKAFARRVLELAEDPPTRGEIEAGRFAFTRARAAGSSAPALESRGAQGAAIERGFVSERYVDSLPQGTSRLVIAKAVRLSPLARDRLRQRGIAIERMER